MNSPRSLKTEDEVISFLGEDLYSVIRDWGNGKLDVAFEKIKSKLSILLQSGSVYTIRREKTVDMKPVYSTPKGVKYRYETLDWKASFEFEGLSNGKYEVLLQQPANAFPIFLVFERISGQDIELPGEMNYDRIGVPIVIGLSTLILSKAYLVITTTVLKGGGAIFRIPNEQPEYTQYVIEKVSP